MIERWQISVGGFTAWLPPLFFACAVLISAWVLTDARRRRFPLYAVAAWTLATLISPPIVLPLYLIARIFKKKPDAPEVAHKEKEEEERPPPLPGGTAAAVAGLEETDAARGLTPHGHISPDNEQTAAQPPQETRTAYRRRNYAPTLFYALPLLLAGAIFFYRDHQSFDAHLARAADARLRGRHAAAIHEYRAALRLSDDAHTHKLLAIQLAEDNQLEAALAEFRAAERGGEPDALLPLRTAHTLDALGRTAEARLEYQKFLRGNLCIRPLPDSRCEEASARAQ